MSPMSFPRRLLVITLSSLGALLGAVDGIKSTSTYEKAYGGSKGAPKNPSRIRSP